MKLLFLFISVFLFFGCTSSNSVENLQQLNWHDFEKKADGSYISIEESNFLVKNFELNVEKKAFVGNSIIEFSVGTKKRRKKRLIKNLLH